MAGWARRAAQSGFEFLTCHVLSVYFIGLMLHIDSIEGHHSAVEHVSYLTFHLHVNVLYHHAIDYCERLKVDSELFQFFCVELNLVRLRLELDVKVGLVTGPRFLEPSDHFLYVLFHCSKVLLRSPLCLLNISCDLLMHLLIFNKHLIF